MRRSLMVTALAVLFFATAMPVATAVPPNHAGRPLDARLSGANEVPPGDPDGSGTARLALNQGLGRICFDLDVSNIATPTRAHIHRGGAGVNGPVVVTFFDTVIAQPVPLRYEGCVRVARSLVKEIRQHPEQFYVNVHNAVHPAGAIRGQLAKR